MASNIIINTAKKKLKGRQELEEVARSNRKIPEYFTCSKQDKEMECLAARESLDTMVATVSEVEECLVDLEKN